MDRYNKISSIMECHNINTKYGLRIDHDEFKEVLKESNYREFEGKWKKWFTGGIGALVGFFGIPVLGGLPLGIFLAMAYRRVTDKCRRSCKDKKCYYKCYLEATENVLKLINRDLSSLSKVSDRKIKKKLENKLKKEKKYFEAKRLKYKKKLENHLLNYK